ncbi:uncharacterized protein LOC134537264 [Bacillus rossius redtenbacheri]|uniref:uncharacterized protein LOC134537264 n=1 Tax=Bacillus rossius redtenbacheri TaxID=93214 RepID=UPI002FDEC841
MRARTFCAPYSPHPSPPGCPDSGPWGSRMTAPDEDYGRRERFLLHHAHQYLPPPSPAHALGDRYIPPPAPGERYIPPPAPGERYLPPPAPAPADRYADRYRQAPAAATPGGPGDPYMRRDLGYHHHYRLPYHGHQYHPHYLLHAHARAPHRPAAAYHHAHHGPAPSPSRAHRRCCPSPSHYPGPPAPTTPTSCPRAPPPPPQAAAASSPVEYVGASGGRHVSTPPPAAQLPRCSSMSSCEAGGGAGGGCDPGSTVSLCCGSGRRFGEPPPAPSLPALSAPHHAAAAVIWKQKYPLRPLRNGWGYEGGKGESLPWGDTS